MPERQNGTQFVLRIVRRASERAYDGIFGSILVDKGELHGRTIQPGCISDDISRRPFGRVRRRRLLAGGRRRPNPPVAPTDGARGEVLAQSPHLIDGRSDVQLTHYSATPAAMPAD